jgi:Rod binding domain-containing protein
MNSAYLPTAAAQRDLPKALDFHPGRGPLSQHDKLVIQARKWVAMSFFEPMLDEMRKSPFRSDMFEGGTAGKAFESLFDERLSERMASDATDTLVKSIVRKIEGSKAYARHARKASGDIESEREGADRVRAIRTELSHVATHF